MSDTGLYSTYTYYTTTSVVYKTYNNTGTGFTLLYSKTTTTFFNYGFITSADGLNFISLDQSGTNQSIKIYYLANSTLRETVSLTTVYPSNKAAALHVSESSGVLYFYLHTLGTDIAIFKDSGAGYS
jgi:hypothetical protein